MRRQIISLAAILALYVALASHFWFVCDDAFISFRYARNLANGYGLVYNLGERVEGYSNFLWVIICAGLHLLGLHQEKVAPFVSCACGGALIIYVYSILRRNLSVQPLSATVAVAFMALSMPFVVWASGGLETMAFTLLVFATFERLVLRQGMGGVSGGVCALLLALIRTEGIGWAVVILGMAAASNWGKLRPTHAKSFQLGLTAAILTASFGAFLLWRHSYYGEWFSNTAYAKAGMSLPRLARGWNYVAVQFLTMPGLLLPVILLPFQKDRRLGFWKIALMALAFPLYAMLVSGDFMAFGRFILPSIPFMACLVGMGLHDLSAILLPGAGEMVTACVIGAGLLPGWDINLVPESIRARHHFRLGAPIFRSEFQQWRFEKENAEHWAINGKALKQIAKPGDSLVTGAIGAEGYYSDLHILDKAGLVTPTVARREVGPAVTSTPGHDKWVEPTWFLQHGFKPTFLGAEVIPGYQFRSQLAEKKRLLESLHLPEYETGSHPFNGGYLLYWKRRQP